jgi:hypothetical protein
MARSAIGAPLHPRRLKIDKNIIADLPDKTEVKTFCPRAASRQRFISRR